MGASRIDLEKGRGRSAFTLIELLVVIAIIAVLVTIGASAVLRYIPVQQQNNTRDIFQAIKPALDRQWSAVVAKARTETIPPTSSVNTWAGSDPQRARVMWIKLRLKHRFPMTFAEATTDTDAAPQLKKNTDYTTYLAGVGSTSKPEYESAACLLMALTSGQGNNAEDFGAAAVGRSNNVPVFVDGWGTPLAFSRWPRGNKELNPGGVTAGQEGFNDPGDPQGLLTVASWLSNSSLRTAFEGACHPVPDRQSNKPYSHNLVPTLVSAGNDREFGLDLTTFAETNTVQAEDNIYSVGR